MNERLGLSRREFLAGASSAAALAALSACAGSEKSSGSGPTSAPVAATDRRVAGQRPDPARPEGTDLLPPIEHIVVVMQENHSYDSYFGMLPRGDGFTRDAHGRPTASNPDASGHQVRAFHMASTCQSHSVSQNWNAMHVQWNNGAMNGFVRSPSGSAAMGYWDGSDLPFYYGLASTFPVCDRWFASTFGQTYPNRRFLLCGSALGSISTISETDLPAPPNGTIFDTLNRNNISWRDYFTTVPSIGLFIPTMEANVDKLARIDQFFTDAAAGRLPSFCLVESHTTNQTEEDPQDISMGEAFVARVVNAVMNSPTWGKTVLVFCYDEHGGYYDHVPPPRAVPPDNFLPILQPHGGEHLNGQAANVPGNYSRYGFRVPAVVVSPYARKNYVSHVVHDHTSILSMVEHKWNLPALSNRDGAADNLLDTLDLTGPPPYGTPPPLSAPKNPGVLPLCQPGQPGPIPNPQG